MTALNRLKSLWRNIFRKHKVEEDLNQEISAFLNSLIQIRIEKGIAPEEARRQALIELGGTEQVKERVRSASMGHLGETLVQDLRHAFRMLLMKPGFTAVAIIALALGIGANTAIFTIVNSVLLDPLAFRDSDRLVHIWESKTKDRNHRGYVSSEDFVELRNQRQVFDDMAAIMHTGFKRTDGESPEEISGCAVSANLFSMLGVKAGIGRLFLPGDEAVDGDAVVVLSNRYWLSRFGADQAVVGRTMILDRKIHTIIGVLPPTFRETFESMPGRAQVWTPTAIAGGQMGEHGPGGLFIVGRLKPGVSIEQGQTEVETITARLAAEYPKTNGSFRGVLAPLQDIVVGRTRQSLVILIIAVGLVLLIACANIANLLLARTIEREKEIAIRVALGAGRLRVIRQLLTESVVLSLAGGTLGLVLSILGVDALIPLIPRDVPRVDEIHISGRVLIFTIAISSFTGILFGLMPALQASKVDLIDSLKDIGYRSIASRRGRHLRGFLVVSQVSLTMVLLCSAGLMINSFVRLYRVDPGFNTENLLTVGISLEHPKYNGSIAQAAFFKQLIDHVRAIPGVQDAVVVTPIPLGGNGNRESVFIEGQTNAGEKTWIDSETVSPGYLRVMGVRLLRGREFAESDGANSTPVVVINESMARRFWSGEDPLGKRLTLNTGTKRDKTCQVIGIAADFRDKLDQTPRPMFYQLYLQSTWSAMSLVVRTTSEPGAMIGQIRAAVRALDKDQPVESVATMKQLWAGYTVQPRFYLLIFSVFGFVAFALAIVGVYGVMAYSVAQRTREIGIRLSLGAQSSDVLKLVVGNGMLQVFIGLAIGVAACLCFTRLLSSLLYEVTATDPPTLISTVLALSVTALIACFIPASRATRVDPIVALRYE